MHAQPGRALQCNLRKSLGGRLGGLKRDCAIAQGFWRTANSLRGLGASLVQSAVGLARWQPVKGCQQHLAFGRAHSPPAAVHLVPHHWQSGAAAASGSSSSNAGPVALGWEVACL